MTLDTFAAPRGGAGWETLGSHHVGNAGGVQVYAASAAPTSSSYNISEFTNT